eukprot:gnl/TRDRNA2_/TRDRNA2_125777_c0_seq1.p1 gnl/TRDRNA2_/TRDRNA2_125777_c0~~gnl/TRDRNA2_/TRDRNA2_125777_c0_seq1.p1  ORF type:complete len:278 (+),score=21.92 gnl/TRDRNA2_/TRDRNA2_125777_c0_seq1:69-902(+)
MERSPMTPCQQGLRQQQQGLMGRCGAPGQCLWFPLDTPPCMVPDCFNASMSHDNRGNEFICRDGLAIQIVPSMPVHALPTMEDSPWHTADQHVDAFDGPSIALNAGDSDDECYDRGEEWISSRSAPSGSSRFMAHRASSPRPCSPDMAAGRPAAHYPLDAQDGDGWRDGQWPASPRSGRSSPGVPLELAVQAPDSRSSQFHRFSRKVDDDEGSDDMDCGCCGLESPRAKESGAPYPRMPMPPHHVGPGSQGERPRDCCIARGGGARSREAACGWASI